MPVLVRVYIRSVLIGVVLACCFVGALLVLDVAHLRHLILNSDMGWLALAMMVVFNTIVFAGVQFAIAVMGQSEKPPSSGRKSPVRPVRAFALYPSPAASKTRK